MACDKPTGDCTNVSPCGSGCSGCGGSTTPAPVLPKCQDVSLTAGTFTHATVTVNSQGCITAIASGEPELYTPDECCGDSGGGGGAAGARGPKGDPGAAATVSVQETIGTGTTWSVENIGTPSAAVFKFTAPAPSTGGGGTTSGYTGTVGGFRFQAGLVKEAPGGIVESVEAKKEGNRASLFSFQAIPDLQNLSEYDITLNLDAFYDSLDNKFTGLHNDQTTLITNLTSTVADLTNQVSGLENSVADLSASLSGAKVWVRESGIYNASGSTITVTFQDISGFAPTATYSSVAVPNNGHVAIPQGEIGAQTKLTKVMVGSEAVGMVLVSAATGA
jgi:hypothetical protein